MSSQPGRDSLRGTIGKQIKRQTPLQITDQCSITQPAFPCPIVQTNDMWFCLDRPLRLTKQTQDGIATATDTQLASKICSCLTPCRKSQLAQRFLQPFGALSMRMTQLCQPLDENLLSTRALFTEETTHMHDQAYWASN